MHGTVCLNCQSSDILKMFSHAESVPRNQNGIHRCAQMTGDLSAGTKTSSIWDSTTLFNLIHQTLECIACCLSFGTHLFINFPQERFSIETNHFHINTIYFPTIQHQHLVSPPLFLYVRIALSVWSLWTLSVWSVRQSRLCFFFFFFGSISASSCFMECVTALSVNIHLTLEYVE